MLISASDIIRNSVELYKKNIHLFLKFVLILFLPSALMGIVNYVLGPVFEQGISYGMLVPMSIYFLVVILSSLVSLWVGIAFVREIRDRLEGRPANDFKITLQQAIPLMWPIILVSILTGLIILAGFILLIIPGIILSIFLAFSYYAVALDNNKPTESLKISRQLVKGRWWSVLWRLFVPALVFALVMIAATWIANIPYDIILKSAFAPGSAWVNFMTLSFVIISTAVNLFFAPLATIAPTILYLELKKQTTENESTTEPPQA